MVRQSSSRPDCAKPSHQKFNYGSQSGASYVPHSKSTTLQGYIEDRRPNSQADPYKIIARLVKTINEVEG